MLAEVVDVLGPALAAVDDAVLVDCTLGLGGHSAALLQAFPGVRLVGIDRDAQALRLAQARLEPFGERVRLFHAVFDELDDVLRRCGVTGVQAVLADLGLSSMQIDDAARGFAYSADTDLDMRMDQDAGESAADLVNGADAAELARILKDFGDERFAPRIVRAIVAARPLRTTGELSRVVIDAIPRGVETGGHPAKRTFQALRIAVNRELDALADFLPQALGALAPGGRLAVLSYHSGEDRLVKRAFAAAAADRAPKGLQVVPDGLLASHRLLTRGAMRPATSEVVANPRSTSARLRAVERVLP
jgi:16S rRNA (cytosine1402-N4)-methyltransferase